MNNTLIHQEIQNLLETIEEQYAQIRSTNGPVPLIEIDLIRSNIARLYDHLNRLKNPLVMETARVLVPPPEMAKPMHPESPVVPVPAQAVQAESPMVTVVKEKTPIVSFVVRPAFVAESQVEKKPDNLNTGIHVQASVPEEKTIPEPEIIQSPEPRAEPPAAVTTQVEENPARKAETRTGAASRRATVQTTSLFDTVMTVAGQYQEQPTLHDKISRNKTDSSLGKKLQHKPVEDLKKSIGINEKFSFINELFDGDLNTYNSVIDTLNKCNNLEEARQLVMEQYASKFAWDRNGKAFSSLSDLLERRFNR